MIDYTLPLDQLPDPLPIEPLRKPFDVTITPPGSKSITCRAYVLAALAEGESKIIRPLRADDTEYLLKALCTLGAEARWEGEDVFIKGVSGRFPRGGTLYTGDGGAPTRFMIACACLAAEPVTIDASPRMRQRPIAEGVEMLRQLGARIEYVEQEGKLPLRVTPNAALRGGNISAPKTQSSQFVSAILLIAPFLRDGIAMRHLDRITSASYLYLTSKMLFSWNIGVFARDARPDLTSPTITPQIVEARDYCVEPDASSALYWWLAAALTPNAHVKIVGIGNRSIQPDVPVVYAMSPQSWHGAPTMRAIDVSGQPKRKPLCGVGGFPTGNAWAAMSPDGALALAVYAATVNTEPDRSVASIERELEACGHPKRWVTAVLKQCQRGLRSRIYGLGTLRVKETDRIAALANELRKVGCTVQTGEDWIEITPPKVNRSHAVSDDRREEDTDPAARGASGSSSLRSSDPASIIIETYNDHRMAMAFAVLGLAAPNGQRLAIHNPACVKKSYPTFWRDFAKLYQ